MSESHGKFCWYELMTTDPIAAGAFYTRVTGWNMEDSGHPDMAYFLFKVGGQGVGGMMALPEEARMAGARPGWLGYILVHDVDAAVAKLQEAGGAVRRPAADIPQVGRFAVVADPQGATFVLFRNIGDQDASPPPAATPGRIGWHELHASEREGAFNFYASQFGWTKADALDMGGPVGIYQIFAINDVPAGGMMNKMEGLPVPFWLFYINVDNINAAVTRVTEAGGQILNGPHEVPGGSWIVQGLDPQGAMFALVGPNN
jgi:predicted enzyme related to lactoylglutathione lyase